MELKNPSKRSLRLRFKRGSCGAPASPSSMLLRTYDVSTKQTGGMMTLSGRSSSRDVQQRILPSFANMIGIFMGSGSSGSQTINTAGVTSQSTLESHHLHLSQKRRSVAALKEVRIVTNRKRNNPTMSTRIDSEQATELRRPTTARLTY
jgi:hypothetical protein